MRKTVKIGETLILIVLLLPNSVWPQENKTWSPADGESSRSAAFQSMDGTGLFLETLEVEKDKGIGLGIMPTPLNPITAHWRSSYFFVPVISNIGVPENIMLEVNSSDKTTLYPVQKVNNDVPKELRPGSQHPLDGGFEAIYVFFPYDADAMHVTIVISLGSTTLRFPFARSPEHMWFSARDTIMNSIAAPPSQPAQTGNDREPHDPPQPSPSRMDIPAISKAANGAIVTIVMADKNGKAIAQGSGFFVSKDGLIVTNYHVIAEGSSAVVKLPTGAFYVVDGVLAFDKRRDVAVIKAHGQDFRTLTLGDSDRVQVGQDVVAIGNPLSLESTVSNGIVSGIRTIEEEGGKYLQVTAPISPGSSGGPLFNMAGEVIGITTLYLKGGENLNFAIPINDARLLISSDSKLQDFPNEPEAVKSETDAEAAAPPSANLTTARAFYNELRDANAFNRYADKYVCFFDDGTIAGQRFMVVSTTGDMVDKMTRDGDTADAKTIAEHGQGLYVQNYYKGIASDNLEFYGKVNGRYSLNIGGGVLDSYMINWTTGRFNDSYQMLDKDHIGNTTTLSGKCELIHSGDLPSIDKGK